MIPEPVSVAVADKAELPGDLGVPPSARGTVLFVHGSGSSRHSPRNRAVAATLNESGWATLLIDLLTEDEERADAVTGRHRFDIPFLTQRALAALDWLRHHPTTRDLPVHLFGASTGAAAALAAAAERPQAVASVVSRGGRPDLAEEALRHVAAPVLLLVGEYDTQVLELNRKAARLLSAEHRLQVIPHATHLFEEPGTLQHVAEATNQWLHHTTSERPVPRGR